MGIKGRGCGKLWETRTDRKKRLRHQAEMRNSACNDRSLRDRIAMLPPGGAKRERARLYALQAAAKAAKEAAKA